MTISHIQIYISGEIFENEEFSHEESTFEPLGFNNNRLNCFMNAVLQSLFACSPFRNFIKSVPHQQGTGIEPSDYLLAPTFFEIRDLLRKISTQRNCADVALIYELWSAQTGLADNQEDAMEFLDFIINRLDTEVLLVNNQSDLKLHSPLIDISGLIYKVLGQEGNETTPTPITRIFYGLIRSKTNRGISENVYPFYRIQLSAVEVNTIFRYHFLNKYVVDLHQSHIKGQDFSCMSIIGVLFASRVPPRSSII